MGETASADCEFYSPSCDATSFWIYLLLCLVLVTAAGLMAGLTIGLLSLDMLNVRILEMEGSDIEKRQAAKVLPVVTKHHHLLVTLLLVNAGANEALPIFLSNLVPEAVSIVLSVTCVLLFGEIIPSAVFSGPKQLTIAAALVPFVKVLMLVTSPISFPISKVLDHILGAGHDPAQYKRKELKALVALQRENEAVRRSFAESNRRQRSTPNSHGSGITNNLGAALLSPRSAFENKHQDSAQGTRLHVDEVTIIHGALDLSAKTVTQVMIPMEQVFMLECDTKLDENVMADILASGHSRIPIYEGHKSNIIGLLLVKRLIVLDPDDKRPIRDLYLRKPIVVSPGESCYAILNEFQKGRSHVALVTEHVGEVMRCWHEGLEIPSYVRFTGIITIEDVIEELIQEEIEDESDVYVTGITNYWESKARKERLQQARKNFVNKKLKILAERARCRVRSRHSAPPTTASLIGTTMQMESPIQIVVKDSPAEP